ncbi:unnamed protein product, partial [Rodentolepis nana]|uniref:Kinesin motor domain-containing protein n=1 Tax=Rodentolepis nana TaxID=102285 RepID=A0A0R3TDF3_RODNA
QKVGAKVFTFAAKRVEGHNATAQVVRGNVSSIFSNSKFRLKIQITLRSTLADINGLLGCSRTRRKLAFQDLDVEMRGGSHENDSHSLLTPDQLMTSG